MRKKPKRFDVVTQWLARGGRPRKKHFAALRAAGIDTIVNVRRKSEAAVIEQCAPYMLAIQIPVRKGCAPSIDQAVKWLRLCDDLRPHRTLFLHGKRGKVRTALFCALVRVAQGWDLQRAISEQRAFGFRKSKSKPARKFLRAFCDALERGEIGIPRL